MSIANTDKIPVLPDSGSTITDANGFIHPLPLALFQNYTLGRPLGDWAKVKTVLDAEGITTFPVGCIIETTQLDQDNLTKKYKLIAGKSGMTLDETHWQYIGLKEVLPLFYIPKKTFPGSNTLYTQADITTGRVLSTLTVRRSDLGPIAPEHNVVFLHMAYVVQTAVSGTEDPLGWFQIILKVNGVSVIAPTLAFDTGGATYVENFYADLPADDSPINIEIVIGTINFSVSRPAEKVRIATTLQALMSLQARIV